MSSSPDPLKRHEIISLAMGSVDQVRTDDNGW
jgi:hypothetical protein